MKVLTKDRLSQTAYPLDDVPLAAYLGLAALTEAAEAEYFFDPADHRLDDRFPTSIAGTWSISGSNAAWSAAQLVRPVATIICNASSTASCPL